MGPVISKVSYKRVLQYIKVAQDQGAVVAHGGKHVKGAQFESGYFIEPTVLANVTPTMQVAREEIFGPVLAIQTFRTLEEGLEKANNTPYGLSGGVWTDKGAKIFRMTQKIRAGVIWANTFNKFDPTSPFGGYKESGVGREGGLHGLGAYVALEE